MRDKSTRKRSVGVVHVEVQDILPLEEAAEAQLISKTGQVRGKLVLSL